MNEQKKYALEQAQRVLRNRMTLMIDQAASLEKALKRLNEPETTAAHSDVFNWAVNDVNNLLLNLGVAELCRVQAMLEVARVNYQPE